MTWQEKNKLLQEVLTICGLLGENKNREYQGMAIRQVWEPLKSLKRFILCLFDSILQQSCTKESSLLKNWHTLKMISFLGGNQRFLKSRICEIREFRIREYQRYPVSFSFSSFSLVPGEVAVRFVAKEFEKEMWHVFKKTCQMTLSKC